MPDMREKVKEYITEIQEEIDRCVKLIEDKFVELENDAAKEVYLCGIEYAKIESRIETLGQIQNDLKNRVEEVIWIIHLEANYGSKQSGMRINYIQANFVWVWLIQMEYL